LPSRNAARTLSVVSGKRERVVSALLERHGQPFARAAGITLRDQPSPLWRLLVLSLLLSARISSDIAVAAARELSTAGYRTPQALVASTWQQRVDALGRGNYRRYDERTATQLGEAAERTLTTWRGDLRRLHDHARGNDVGRKTEQLLQGFTGIGPAGAASYCREVQGVWTDLAPYVDDLAADGAERLGLPRTPSRLAALVPAPDLTRLVAGCVRAARDEAVVADVTGG